MPPDPAAGVPDNTPLVLRVTPEGRAPVSVKVGAGLPLAAAVKDTFEPAAIDWLVGFVVTVGA